ncbi:hypothetical protein JHK82_052308 [Glycine max]|uniref:Ribosome biogenesis protein WDR12 homolog n=1 Tax=Glycine soja TaxID=3848 RepID=A0A445FBM7_GLYSO|nr:hypothetical protein JHK82_052308 [Glycine max]RZB46223.1 Ribosome biogenesis protein WDR12-like [Glycine soja]
MNMNEESVEGSARRIQVRFVTKLGEPYKVPTTAIAIPADLARFGLSSLVNALLQSNDADHQLEPFDFLIDGEFVRMSLEQFLLAKGISACVYISKTNKCYGCYGGSVKCDDAVECEVVVKQPSPSPAFAKSPPMSPLLPKVTNPSSSSAKPPQTAKTILPPPTVETTLPPLPMTTFHLPVNKHHTLFSDPLPAASNRSHTKPSSRSILLFDIRFSLSIVCAATVRDTNLNHPFLLLLFTILVAAKGLCLRNHFQALILTPIFIWDPSSVFCTQHLEDKERILEIEYTRAVAPRKEEDPSLHDDWVSAVDGSSSRFFLTGCYDGLGRVWKGAGLCTHILEGHSDAVTSVSIINPKGEETITVATASKDRTLRLWKLNAEGPVNNPMRVRAYKIFRGHKSSVNCVAAQTSGEMVCSASWDCTINLWQTNDFNAEDDLVSKKRKIGAQVEESQLEGEAFTTLVGHTQCVSAVVWPQQESIYSASWDHSIRKWDVETGKNLTDLFCGKVLNCLDIGGEGSALIAAGGSDPVIRIWDPRKPGTSAPVFQFSSHTSWISACKWHDQSWFHLLSASYDGKVMLWDLRTAWPLSVIESHSDKVLSADWWKSNSVISGGADSKLCISSEIPVK